MRLGILPNRIRRSYGMGAAWLRLARTETRQRDPGRETPAEKYGPDRVTMMPQEHDATRDGVRNGGNKRRNARSPV